MTETWNTLEIFLLTVYLIAKSLMINWPRSCQSSQVLCETTLDASEITITPQKINKTLDFLLHFCDALRSCLTHLHPVLSLLNTNNIQISKLLFGCEL